MSTAQPDQKPLWQNIQFPLYTDSIVLSFHYKSLKRFVKRKANSY